MTNSLAGTFEGVPNIYVPAGWNAVWNAAKASAASSPARMTIVGDSFSVCIGASDFLSKGWVGLVTAWLQATYGAGSFFYPTNFAVTPYGQTGAPWGGTDPWIFTAAAGNGQAGGPYTASWTGQTGVAGLATFTSPSACTALDIVWYDQTAGTWGYSVDGGAYVTVTPTGAGYLKRTSITGLANTTHTVAFGNQSGDGVMRILGVAAYQSTTTGIHVANLSVSGFGMFHWAFFGALDLMRGKAASTTGFGFPYQPHLLIVAMSINDMTNQKQIGYFAAQTSRLIQAARRGVANCSVILMANATGDPYSADYAWTNSATSWMYSDALARLALIYGAAFANVNARWGETPNASGFIAGNNHPNDAGNADMATFLEQIL